MSHLDLGRIGGFVLAVVIPVWQSSRCDEKSPMAGLAMSRLEVGGKRQVRYKQPQMRNLLGG
jgi:hypothetical protein